MYRRAGALACLGLTAVGLAALTAACTNKPVRPAPGAALIEATALDDTHGLLVFRHTPPEGEASYFVGKHATDGAIAWTRTLGPGQRAAPSGPLRVIGDAGLLVLEDSNSAQSLLRIDLERGESIEWTSEHPTSVRPRVLGIVGDAAQVFVFWTALTGPVASLEISAFDPHTGAKQWTVSRPVGALLEVVMQQTLRPWPLRLDDEWLMYSDGERDWQLLRRSDGARDQVVVADPSGMCHAGGRWWAQRDDRLLALDTRGAQIEVQETVAEFIAPERRHQWTLADCGEAKDEARDEVVLTAHAGPGAGGLVVGIDPVTAQARWSVALPLRGPPRIAATVAMGPRQIGAVALASSWQDHCAVDLPRRELLWCVGYEWGDAVIADGEDTLLFGDSPEGQHIVRISGADGKVAAAVELRGARSRDTFAGDVPALAGGKLWLASAEDPGATVGGRLPHMVLDARTLRPIVRPAYTDSGAIVDEPVEVAVLDISAELDRRYHFRSDDREIPRAFTAMNPLEHWIFNGPRPAETSPPEPARAGLHDELLQVARRRAKLPVDAPMRVLAWRSVIGDQIGFVADGELAPMKIRRDDVLAIGEQHGPDGTRWVLVIAKAFTGALLQERDVELWSFDRRPEESDVHRFLLHVEPSLGPAEFDVTQGTVRGAIDEPAWQAVFGAPRSQQWLL